MVYIWGFICHGASSSLRWCSPTPLMRATLIQDLQQQEYVLRQSIFFSTRKCCVKSATILPLCLPQLCKLCSPFHIYMWIDVTFWEWNSGHQAYCDNCLHLLSVSANSVLTCLAFCMPLYWIWLLFLDFVRLTLVSAAGHSFGVTVYFPTD